MSTAAFLPRAYQPYTRRPCWSRHLSAYQEKQQGMCRCAGATGKAARPQYTTGSACRANTATPASTP